MNGAVTPPFWDQYDRELDRDPHAMFRRLRDEAPLYHNADQGFYALRRFADCRAALDDPDAFTSGRGVILEVIKAGVSLPRGFFICEDPPIHTVHRGILGRTFTAPRMARLEEQIRAFCARTLDPLVGAGGFDLIHDFASQVPMKVIGMLLGIAVQRLVLPKRQLLHCRHSGVWRGGRSLHPRGQVRKGTAPRCRSRRAYRHRYGGCPSQTKVGPIAGYSPGKCSPLCTICPR